MYMKGDSNTEKWKEKVQQFEESEVKRLRVPEWRVILALAYNGHQSRYDISKAHNTHYGTVHHSVKNMKKAGWVKVVKKRYSMKNVLTQIYGLTREGLLWLLSRIPRSFHPSLIYSSEEDTLGLRKALSEKDVSKVENLETQRDVHLHLLLDFDFNVDKIAENNTNLFPLIFGNWNLYKELGVTQDIIGELPQTAFSTLVDYYHDYPEALRLGSLEKLFTYKCYYNFLKLHSGGHPNIDTESKDQILGETVGVFGSSPELQKLFCEISSQLKKTLSEKLTFIETVRSRLPPRTTHS